MVQYVAFGTRFSKETDARASRLVDADSDVSVVQEFPLILFGFGLGVSVLCRSVEREESDPNQANDDWPT